MLVQEHLRLQGSVEKTCHNMFREEDL